MLRLAPQPLHSEIGVISTALGIVPSFSQPGGNLTGVATLSSAVMAKRMEFLRELAPYADLFGVLIIRKIPVRQSPPRKRKMPLAHSERTSK
jgi:hypothetical protein